MTCTPYTAILVATAVGLACVVILGSLIYAAGRTKGLTEPREEYADDGETRGEIP